MINDYSFLEISPLVIFHGSIENHIDTLKEIKNIELILYNNEKNTNYTKPYYSLFSWEEYQPNRLDTLFEIVRKQNKILNTSILICNNMDDISPKEKNFINELGIMRVLSINEGKDQLQNYFDNEKYQAELVGSNYQHICELYAKYINNQSDEIETQLRMILNSNPNYPLKHLVANTYLSLKKNDEAEHVLRQLMISYPEELWPVHQLSLVYIKNSQYAKALELMERLETYHSTNPQRIYYLGNLYVKIYDFKKAYHLFSTGRNTCPQFANRFLDGLIIASIGLEKEYEEIAILLKERKILKDTVLYLSNLCKKYFDEKSFQKIEYILNILEISLSKSIHITSNLYYNMGVVDFYQNNIDRCMQALDKAIKINPAPVTPAAKFSNYLSKIQKLNETQQTLQLDSLRKKEKISWIPLINQKETSHQR